MIRLTREKIDACRTEGGSITEETARLLGAELPLVQGWAHALIGTAVLEADYEAARAARHVRRFEPWFQKSPGQMGFDL